MLSANQRPERQLLLWELIALLRKQRADGVAADPLIYAWRNVWVVETELLTDSTKSEPRINAERTESAADTLSGDRRYRPVGSELRCERVDRLRVTHLLKRKWIDLGETSRL